MPQPAPVSPARVAFEKFSQKHPDANRFRISTKNQNGRWTGAGDAEDFEVFCLPGTVYRFQAYDGRKVAGFDVWESPPLAPDQVSDQDKPTQQEIDLLTAPLDLAPPPAPLPVLVQPPAPASVDPWLDLFRQRMEQDNKRIQELHQTVLSLVGSVSQHHQGATAPLIKLIDQLGRSLTRFHVQASERIDHRQGSLSEREAFIEAAEEVAETKLIEVEEAAKATQNESAIISGLVQHLGPALMEKLTP
jgi:hypothetical protein